MGRGGTIPACADAIALASVGPMRIGTRSSESGSRSSTTISSSARCWRTPTTSTGTSSASSPMRPTLRRGRRSGCPRGQRSVIGPATGCEVGDGRAHERGVHLRAQLADLGRQRARARPRRRAALPTPRRDDLLDQVGLPVRGRAELPQVTRVDAVLGEGRGGDRRSPGPTGRTTPDAVRPQHARGDELLDEADARRPASRASASTVQRVPATSRTPSRVARRARGAGSSSSPASRAARRSPMTFSGMYRSRCWRSTNRSRSMSAGEYCR